MGQLIEVTATNLGGVALFALDRSLTGQDGVTFVDGGDSNDPPTTLANRLIDADPAIESIHIMSNVVSVARKEPWDDGSLDDASGIISKLFLVYDLDALDDRLREDNYNATITSIRAHNPELWVMAVRPDEPLDPYKPGQYTTLALGYWEPRADEASEDFESHPEQRGKMARRSYSVSSSVVAETGDLVEDHPEDVEFYIVQVRPGEVEIPALTPRIFKKGVGDRIYMGRKFTGRYTLDGVEPTDNIVFLSTGTGEAPQNNMTAELLRTGHPGKIINIVCVRYWEDLAYTEQQAVVQSRFPNYQFMAITTREPENEGNKVYIQDLVTSGRVEDELGDALDPGNTHVFLCGNPAMIGLPKWDDDAGTMEFPEPVGVCELLHARGFTIDHRNHRGNVHYEEYWKER